MDKLCDYKVNLKTLKSIYEHDCVYESIRCRSLNLYSYSLINRFNDRSQSSSNKRCIASKMK